MDQKAIEQFKEFAKHYNTKKNFIGFGDNLDCWYFHCKDCYFHKFEDKNWNWRDCSKNVESRFPEEFKFVRNYLRLKKL